MEGEGAVVERENKVGAAHVKRSELDVEREKGDVCGGTVRENSGSNEGMEGVERDKVDVRVALRGKRRGRRTGLAQLHLGQRNANSRTAGCHYNDARARSTLDWMKYPIH